MILYNTTFIVDEAIHDKWFDWFKKEYVKNYLDTNCFMGARLGKITSHVEPGAISYSLQLFVNDIIKLDQFKNNFLGEIQQIGVQKFGTQVLSFTSEMEHIGDFS